ncbi:MAG: BglG family transcription antiterminator LicT [Lachnospiraceae bacterium]
MIVKKILNNNVITSLDERGQEIVIMGKGIGWKLTSGEEIDETKIEKIFRMDTASSMARMKKLLLEVQPESVRISSRIIDYAREHLGKELKKNIYITLTDHIDFAIERFRNGIQFHSALFWEIKMIYPKEFQIGIYGLKIIEEELGIVLPEEEAASIALHLVNAQTGESMTQTQSMIDLIAKSLNIVRLFMREEFREDSLDYQRFVTHLMFFAQRVLEGKNLALQQNFLYETMRPNYEKEFRCAEKIARYVEREYNVDIGKEEITFLAVHIIRVTAKTQ